MPNQPRNWSRNTAAYGSIGERVEWQNVLEHYYWDRLEEAFRTAEALGAGLGAQGLRLYRMVEAEYMTRVRGTRRQVADWLEIEVIPDEIELSNELIEGIASACDAIADKLGWEHGPQTLVSVLSDEADAPWTLGRYGYMVDKHPLDKICIPLRAARDPDALHEVVAHEYAHVISLNLSQGRVPRWLDEAVAMSAETDRKAPAQDFVDGKAPWLSPRELEIAFGREQNDSGLWWAYQQSHVIGEFLIALAGSARLGDLLRGFANNSGWTELKMAITGQPHEDEALREVYGIGLRELFERADPRAPN